MNIDDKQTEERHHGEAVWSAFTRRFQFLATEAAKSRPLTVSEDLPHETNKFGVWVFSPPFLVLDRFQEAAGEAGKSLGCPEGTDPIDCWPHHLSVYLWRYINLEGLRLLDLASDGRRQRVIEDVLLASEKFSRWLAESPSNALAVLTEGSSESPPWKGAPSMGPKR